MVWIYIFLLYLFFPLYVLTNILFFFVFVCISVFEIVFIFLKINFCKQNIFVLYWFMRRMFIPTRGNHIRLMSTIKWTVHGNINIRRKSLVRIRERVATISGSPLRHIHCLTCACSFSFFHKNIAILTANFPTKKTIFRSS